MTVGPENIVVAELTELRSGPPVSGSLEPERAATVRAEVSGSVLKTEAEEGARVQRGALLASLDDTAVRDAYLSARSQVRSAESALEVARRNAERAERLSAAGRDSRPGPGERPPRPDQRRRRPGRREGPAGGRLRAAGGHPDPRAFQRSRERPPGGRGRRGTGGCRAVHDRGPAGSPAGGQRPGEPDRAAPCRHAGRIRGERARPPVHREDRSDQSGGGPGHPAGPDLRGHPQRRPAARRRPLRRGPGRDGYQARRRRAGHRRGQPGHHTRCCTCSRTAGSRRRR